MTDADETLLLVSEGEHHRNLAPLENLPEPRGFLAEASGKVWFRGGWTCSCVADSLPLVELIMLTRGLLNESIDIFQLGWSTGVSASAGTHSQGGCVDVGQYSDAHIAVWRWAGWTMQHRTPEQGFDHHAHGFPWGCSHLAPAAQAQATQWSNRQNGLVSHGPIAGAWPVVNYRTGITRMENELTKFADDIVARTSDRVTKAILARLNDIPTQTADRVWNADNMIDNVGFTGNTANPGLAASNALEETFKEVASVRKRVDAGFDAILAKPNEPVA